MAAGCGVFRFSVFPLFCVGGGDETGDCCSGGLCVALAIVLATGFRIECGMTLKTEVYIRADGFGIVCGRMGCGRAACRKN